MKHPKKVLTSVVAGTACVGLLACGPNTKSGEEKGESIDHATAKQAIVANTRSVSSSLGASIAFLETSNVFAASAEAAFPGTADECLGCDEPVEPTEPAELEIDFDAELEAQTDEMTQWLETHVFTDANVESEDGTSVTYLLDGATVCAAEGAADPDCVANVDQLELRLVVESPAAGDVDVDVLIGPDQHNPLSLQVHSDMLAVEIDFAGIKGAIEHIDSIQEIDADLPATFEGRIRGELLVEGPEKVKAALSVLSAVNVADGDISISLGESSPAFSVAIDGTAKTLTAVNDLGRFIVEAPMTTYSYDSETQVETETSHDVKIDLAGLTATTVLDAAAELITVTGAGLGNGTSTVHYDGAEVLAIDLNDGGTFDATIASAADDTLSVEVAPKFDLSVALKFAAVADAMDDVEEWMLDDVLSVVLDGAAAPKLEIKDGQLKVVEGQLSLSLQNEGSSHTITAGQCLLGTADDGDVAVEPGSEIEPDPVPEQSGPLDGLEAGTCE